QVQSTESVAPEGLRATPLCGPRERDDVPEGDFRVSIPGDDAEHRLRIAQRAVAAATAYAVIAALAGGCCTVAVWAALRLTKVFAPASPDAESALWLLALLYGLVGMAGGAVIGGALGACISLRRTIVDEGEVRRIASTLQRAIMRRIEAQDGSARRPSDAWETSEDADSEPAYSAAVLPAAEVVELAERIIRHGGDSAGPRMNGVRGRLAATTERLLLTHYGRLFLDDLRAIGDHGVVTLSQVKEWAAERVEAAIRTHLNAYARTVCLSTLLIVLIILAIPVMVALTA
ncbi:MAG: hypothetical protein ACE5O2_07145, partial [Armatimonadota bacterium]